MGKYICKSDFRGAIDGVNVIEFCAGRVYELPIAFAADPVKSGTLAPCEDVVPEPAGKRYRVLKPFQSESGTAHAAGDTITITSGDPEALIDGGFIAIAPAKEAPQRAAKTKAPQNKARK